MRVAKIHPKNNLASPFIAVLRALLSIFEIIPHKREAKKGKAVVLNTDRESVFVCVSFESSTQMKFVVCCFSEVFFFCFFSLTITR